MKDAGKSILLNNLKHDTVEHSLRANFFKLPLSDFDIIAFQNLLMTPSVHYITTQNASAGRSLMNLFLSAFKHYHNIGCLTINQSQKLFDNIFDFSKLQQGETSLIDSIELFCIENPCLDFVWIEKTQALQNQISNNQLRKICELFSSDGQTPVVVMSYQEDCA